MIGDLEGLNEKKVAALEERGKPHGLSAQEVLVADQTGMTAERYALMKEVRNVNDFERAKEASRRAAEAREEFERERLVEKLRAATP